MGEPLFTSDAVVLGILITILAVVFNTSSSNHPGYKKFYSIIPMLLLCYFIPSLFTTFGIIAPKWYVDIELADFLRGLGLVVPEGLSVDEMLALAKENKIKTAQLKPVEHHSNLYYVASRFLLPASLILLTMGANLKEIFKLGPKALIMFFTGTIGVMIGGPLAVLLVSFVSPETVGGQGPDEVWRGLSTVAGSWIGGGANQAAMKEIFQPSGDLFSISVTIDIVVAEIWMFFLLLGVGKSKEIDKMLKADNSSIETLKERMHKFSLSLARIATSTDLMMILGIGLGFTAAAHFVANQLSPFFTDLATKEFLGGPYPWLARISLTSHFFWLIVLSTVFGIILSTSKWRHYEGAGGSKVGTVFIYFLVATIGMEMDITKILDNPGLFVVGLIWMAIHVILLILVAFLIRAPYFFVAVGSKANIGGAASAPVVAAAFHPSLAPVGVLLAVVGYAVGTLAAYVSGLLMQGVSPIP